MVSTYGVFSLILARLFYWQIIKGPELLLAAEDQYQSFRQYLPSRGRIFTADGYSLVDNTTVYRLFAEPQVIQADPAELADQLSQIILEEELTPTEATDEAIVQQTKDSLTLNLIEKLNSKRQWIALDHKILEPTKQTIEQLGIHGLGFDPYEVRSYPEASMAAHVTGFVGKNEAGEDVGYFGVEGALDKELKGVTVSQTTLTDAKGLPLLFSDLDSQQTAIPGRDITLTIRRDIQFLLETELERGMRQYGAKSGEIIVVEPSTGKILGLATWPKYDQATFFEFDPELYKNPSLTDVYEPGSTFKTLTVSAGIDSGAITPDTPCPKCSGPRKIAEFTIKTWNDVYHPNISMTEALAKSDNTAMIFIGELLGADTFVEYLNRFGIGQPLDIDLQEDTSTPFKDTWRFIDVATGSFGQGVVTNSLQLVRAVGAIANQGEMMHLQIIDSVYDPATGKSIQTPVISHGQVISAQSAATVTSMMIEAAEAGEAQWTASDTYTVAGKTGTSQVAEDGEYAEDKTIASFIGFAPPEEPRFVMLVKLNEPSSSPWAAETAAPLWYRVADKLFLLLNIPQ